MLGSVNLNDNELTLLCSEVRHSIFKTCLNAKSGHIGGCSGAVELMTTLYFGGCLRIDGHNHGNPLRDRVLVRGHLGPLRYKLFSLMGFIEETELAGYRTFHSRLKGHEDFRETPGVDITPSGSLGMLLSYGVGAALNARALGADYRTYVFLGDGEEEEGSISEAARHAALLRLNNIIVILDQNAKQLSNPLCDTDCADVAALWEAYGWNVILNRNGNSVPLVRDSYQLALSLAKVAKESGKPTVIMAQTVKGLGLSGAENHFSGYHTISTCSPGIVHEAALILEAELKTSSEERHRIRDLIHTQLRSGGSTVSEAKAFRPLSFSVEPGAGTPRNPDFCQGDYFQFLSLELRRHGVSKDDFFFLTADVTKQDDVESLGLNEFASFMNTGIREQHTIALAHGLSISRPCSRIIINSFDAFAYRWLDQINAAAQGGSSMVIIGDIAGLTNSRNGKTHQTNAHPSAIFSIPGVTFLEPADVLDTFNCLNWAIGEGRGVIYIRVFSENCPDLEVDQEERNLAYYIAWGSRDNADIVIVASGLTVTASIEASIILAEAGIASLVINVINPKSLDLAFSDLISGMPVLTVYNGSPRVLQSIVSMCALDHCRPLLPKCVRGMGFEEGDTGSTTDLLRFYRLDAAGIVAGAQSILSSVRQHQAKIRGASDLGSNYQP